jgi:hypothetical protein
MRARSDIPEEHTASIFMVQCYETGCRGTDVISRGYEAVACFCEHYNESSGFTEVREFEYLSNKQDSALQILGPCSYGHI